MSRWSLLPIVEIKYTGEYNRLFKVYNYKFLIKSGSVPSYFFATEGTQKRPDSVRTHYDLPLTFAFSSLLPHNIVSRPGLLAQSLGVTVNETNQTPSNRLERHWAKGTDIVSLHHRGCRVGPTPSPLLSVHTWVTDRTSLAIIFVHGTSRPEVFLFPYPSRLFPFRQRPKEISLLSQIDISFLYLGVSSTSNVLLLVY